jgi:hypothetical protein
MTTDMMLLFTKHIRFVIVIFGKDMNLALLEA